VIVQAGGYAKTLKVAKMTHKVPFIEQPVGVVIRVRRKSSQKVEQAHLEITAYRDCGASGNFQRGIGVW